MRARRRQRDARLDGEVDALEGLAEVLRRVGDGRRVNQAPQLIGPPRRRAPLRCFHRYQPTPPAAPTPNVHATTSPMLTPLAGGFGVGDTTGVGPTGATADGGSLALRTLVNEIKASSFKHRRCLWQPNELPRLHAARHVAVGAMVSINPVDMKKSRR